MGRRPKNTILTENLGQTSPAEKGLSGEGTKTSGEEAQVGGVNRGITNETLIRAHGKDPWGNSQVSATGNGTDLQRRRIN